MIAMIKGEVVALSVPVVCVMTAGGVGYNIEMAVNDFCRMQLGEMVNLHTHLAVREDQHSLYGFCYPSDKEVFKKLIKINGVGAKMALAILSSMSATDLAEHIAANNETALTRIPGVGKKTAQRLIIEMTGKLDAGDRLSLDKPKGTQMQLVYEIESALIGLGYKEKEAQSAIKQCYQDGMDTQSLLKSALKVLSGF